MRKTVTYIVPICVYQSSGDLRLRKTQFERNKVGRVYIDTSKTIEPTFELIEK